VEADARSSAAAEGKAKAKAETQRAQSSVQSENIVKPLVRRSRLGPIGWRAELAATNARRQGRESLRLRVIG
jgi:hypothetical protein